MLSIQSSNSTSRAMMVPSLSQRMLPPTFRIPSFRTSGEAIPFESQTIRPGRGLVFRRLRRLLSRSSRTTKRKLSRDSGNSCRRASAFRPIWKKLPCHCAQNTINVGFPFRSFCVNVRPSRSVALNAGSFIPGDVASKGERNSESCFTMSFSGCDFRRVSSRALEGLDSNVCLSPKTS